MTETCMKEAAEMAKVLRAQWCWYEGGSGRIGCSPDDDSLS